MAGSREAKLIMRLVDQVTGPGRAIARSLGVVDKAVRGFGTASMAPARAIGQMGRGFRHNAQDAAAFSATLGIGVSAAGRAVYAYEKAGNRMQAFGLLTEGQRAGLEQLTMTLNKEFPHTNSMILEAAAELFRAGLTYDQAMGALRGSLQLSLAGDISTKEAADIATNVMYAMKLPMETSEQVLASMEKINDLIAYAATKSNTDVRLMGDTFRYVAPLAAAAGMEIEEVTALAMKLANAGIKGSEAGVALRSALVRMAKPTKPMLAAFERLGISMEDFVEYKERIDADSVIGSLLPSGHDVSILRDQIQAILDDPKLAAAPQRMVAQLSDLIVGTIGDEAVRKDVTSAIQDAVLAGAQKVDLLKLLKVMREKGATITDIAQIFDVRMGSRLAAILYEDLDEATAKVKEGYRGVANEMAGLMMQGIVGAWARVIAALENLSITLAQNGVLDTVASSFDRFSDAINRLSKTSPDLLKIGTYAVLALAALAPLGFFAAGAASALALLINPITLLGGALAVLAATNLQTITDFFKVVSSSVAYGLKPEIAESFRALASAVREFFTSPFVTSGNADEIGQTFRDIGLGIADGINRAYGALSQLDEVGQRLRSFFSSAWSAHGASVVSGLNDLKTALSGFVSLRLDSIGDLGDTLAGFWAKIGPHLSMGPALETIGASIQTLVSGIRALGSIGGGVLDGVISFLNGFVSNIDDATVTRIANGLANGFDLLTTAANRMKTMFDGLANMSWPQGGWFEAGAAFARNIQQIIDMIAAALEKVDWIEEKALKLRSLMIGGATGFSPAGAGSANADPMKPIMPGDPNAALQGSGADAFIRGEQRVTPQVDTTQIDNAQQRAGEAGSAIQQGLSVKVTPQVNSGQIDAALQKALALRRALAATSGAAASAARGSGGGSSGSGSSTPAFAGGGSVWGPGTGTSDSILARLSNGEFVVNARSAERNRPILEALNSGRRFHDPMSAFQRSPIDDIRMPAMAPSSQDNSQHTNHFHIKSTDPKGAADEVGRVLSRVNRRSVSIAIDGRGAS